MLQPRFLHLTIYKNIRIEGFVVSQWASEFSSGLQQLAKWVKEGKILVKEDIMKGGIKKAPDAFFLNYLMGRILENNLCKLLNRTMVINK